MKDILDRAWYLLRIGARPKNHLPIEVMTWIAKRDKTETPTGMSIEYGENGASLRMESDSEASSEDSTG